MIRDAKDFNATVAPNTRDLERVRAALPEFFSSDGTFMVDRLEETLQAEDVRIAREGYELKFLGKSYGKFQSSTKAETVIVPDDEHNAREENATSENLYIVGDNLDALKHLLHSYSGKVKCIYIDPPYNTGTDGFVYNDDFGFSAKELVEKLGIGADEAKRILSMHGKSSHSAWLTFMLPRLLLARDLMSDDGVIFISIDENEHANLKLLCDDIFGEQNNLGELIWKTATDNNPTQISIEHEYVVAYSRIREQQAKWSRPSEKAALIENAYLELSRGGPTDPATIQTALRSWIRENEGALQGVAHYSYVDERGVFYPGNSANTKPGPYTYDIEHPVTGRVCAKPANGYRWPQSTFIAAAERDDVLWGVDEQTIPKIKKRVETATEGLQSVYYEDNRATTELLRAMFGSKVFDNPKSINLIKRLVSFTTGDDSIVVDFFSGSATTAHAVMELNAEGNANRKYILVQLPEEIDETKPAYEAGYRTIDEIGRERIRRAAAKIKEETGADFDSGFKLVRLHAPTDKTIVELEAFDPDASTDLFAEDMTERFSTSYAAGRDVVLTTWLNQDGFGLHAKAKQVRLDEYEIDVIEDSAYIVSPGFGSADAEKLVQLIESGELPLRRLVLFGYNIDYSAKAELVANLKNPKTGRAVELLVRF
ncbi:DNA methyltransferase [Agrococcus casei]|uniref:site-specific DNA-methyltransferase n=1 Tax=Agrococcus casei TaxID=343512 RepID=UPI003F8F5FA1